MVDDVVSIELKASAHFTCEFVDSSYTVDPAVGVLDIGLVGYGDEHLF